MLSINSWTGIVLLAASPAGTPNAPERPSASSGSRAVGADLIVGNITGPSNYGQSEGYVVYSAGATYCNLGSIPAEVFALQAARHPVLAQGLYRLKIETGTNYYRLEQISQKWPFHDFCSLQQGLCGTCAPNCGGCCNYLGVGCSESNSSSIHGGRAYMGPRYEVNGSTGEFLEPRIQPSNPNTVLNGRLATRVADIDPAVQPPGTQYYVEVQVLGRDDAAWGNDRNNASFRRVGSIGPAPNFNISFSGTSTVREQPALRAWQAADPGVTIVSVDVLNDGIFTVPYAGSVPPPKSGRLLLGARATRNVDSSWHYEYVLYNLSSHRAAGSLRVPLGTACAVRNIGFHDVDYHSGEIQVGTDWTVSMEGGAVAWATEPYDAANSETANALRWGTMYNFRFDADRAPVSGEVEIGLFRPPSFPGDPMAHTLSVPVPSPSPLIAGDLDGDDDVDSDDVDLIVAVLLGFETERCLIDRADLNGGGVDGSDIQAMVKILIP